MNKKYYLAILTITILIIYFYKLPKEKKSYNEYDIKAQNGKQIFKDNCSTCHSINISNTSPVNAPRLSVKNDWTILYKDREQALNLVIYGNKNMPARGNCNNCSEQQLDDALEYIINYHK